MSNELVITAYGHGQTIDKIAATIFAAPDGKRTSNAAAYCNTLNSLRLEGNSWVFARIASENTPCSLDSFLPVSFDILLKLDDMAIQKIMREVDSQDLGKALIGQNTALQDKIFRNMPERAAAMLKEDMEYMAPVPKSEIKEGQRKILEIYRRFVGIGELFSEEDTDRDDDASNHQFAEGASLRLVNPTEDSDG